MKKKNYHHLTFILYKNIIINLFFQYRMKKKIKGMGSA